MVGDSPQKCIGILEVSRTRDTCDFGLGEVNTRAARWRETLLVHQLG